MVNTGEVSVTLSENGWAWLVSGRRLVVWRYNGVGRAQCRELSLPPSDLKHRCLSSRLIKRNSTLEQE